MIYQMFASAAVDGVNWFEWVLLVIAALYIIQGALLLVSYLGQQGYRYIHDWVPKGRMVYNDWLASLVNPPKPEEPEESQDTGPKYYTGWVRRRSSNVSFSRFRKGYFLETDICSIRTSMMGSGSSTPCPVISDAIWEDQYDYREDRKTHRLLADVPTLLEPVKTPEASNLMYALWLGPAILGAMFIFLDTLPVAAISLATVYATLRTARAIVRTMKRVTKLESSSETSVPQETGEGQ